MSVAVRIERHVTTPAQEETEGSWLDAFHRGERDTLARCDREHFATVERAVGALLSGPDRETIVHDVFCELLANAELRRSFGGGSLAAWLGTIARHRAIDHLRRRDREPLLLSGAIPIEAAGEPWNEEVEAAMLIDRFRKERLPPEWQGTFEALFIQQMSQREAAAAIGVGRTTLAYRELRIRSLLKRFLFGRSRR
jgi:RNA polymerase sigma-70 factor (ECF subfamily)